MDSAKLLTTHPLFTVTPALGASQWPSVQVASVQPSPDFSRTLESVRRAEPPQVGQAGSPATAATPATPLPDSTPLISPRVVVQPGDTLVAIVRRHLGPTTDAHASYQAALRVAAANQLSNPDRIRPGQSLDLSVLGDASHSRTAAPAARSAVSDAPLPALPLSFTVTGIRATVSASAGAAHPLLDKTLERATDRGFIPRSELHAVKQKVLGLAEKHGFAPDDFARSALMESDGFNPRAQNGRCFGIIQFCAGPDRGAASAGYAHNPQGILKLSVLQQLDLVDRYFDDTRLKDFRSGKTPVGLDDLYLTILTPAARLERRVDAPLPIMGPQAQLLHVAQNTRAPITRSSILNGLWVNAKDKLGLSL